MTIQIDGTNTLNKGAELMLYAVLQQIERNCPTSNVIYNPSNRDKTDISYVPENINLKKRWIQAKGRYPEAIFRKLGLNYSYFTSKHPLKNIDVMFDAGGFQFSDQWSYSNERLRVMETYYSKLKAYGTKLIFLPQALGPFESKSGKKTVEILKKYADVVIAREPVSYDFMIEAGFPKTKLWLYPDFTLRVRIDNISHSRDVTGGACFIPNKKMLTHTTSKKETYLKLFRSLINISKERGLNPFLLNHEGKGDYDICLRIAEGLDFKLPILTNLNAYEVKSVIGKSLFVVSSRFHGVASSLNQGVPCLATSWNHKYGELFKDFGIYDSILKVEDKSFDDNVNLFMSFLNEESMEKQRATLKSKRAEIGDRIDEMWDKIWNTIEN